MNNVNVRLGVVGAGNMGSNHVRVASNLKGFEVAAIVDTDLNRAQKLVDIYGGTAFQTIEEALPGLDAVIVAVPSVLHSEIGLKVLLNGTHCLIEKPFATTDTDARALIGAAHDTGARLLVGHIERFNPAIIQMSSLFDSGKNQIHAIETRRMSGSSSRITDVNVVMDLMLHDLDILQSLIKEPVSTISAHSVKTNNRLADDYVSALISFENGTVATLTASRITQNKIRILEVTSEMGHITLDYSTQELCIFRQGGFDTHEIRDGYVMDISMEKVLIRSTEPLANELLHFRSVVLGEAEPKVTGEDALRSMQLVWKIQDLIKVV